MYGEWNYSACYHPPIQNKTKGAIVATVCKSSVSFCPHFILMVQKQIRLHLLHHEGIMKEPGFWKGIFYCSSTTPMIIHSSNTDKTESLRCRCGQMEGKTHLLIKTDRFFFLGCQKKLVLCTVGFCSKKRKWTTVPWSITEGFVSTTVEQWRFKSCCTHH